MIKTIGEELFLLIRTDGPLFFGIVCLRSRCVEVPLRHDMVTGCRDLQVVEFIRVGDFIGSDDENALGMSPASSDSMTVLSSSS